MECEKIYEYEYPRNMVCFRCINVNTLHKGDDDDDDDGDTNRSTEACTR
jgi:hypothetical protein